jgi:hypothetical protein
MDRDKELDPVGLQVLNAAEPLLEWLARQCDGADAEAVEVSMRPQSASRASSPHASPFVSVSWTGSQRWEAAPRCAAAKACSQ